jgi:phosphonate transport system ATP-binding protein
MILAGNARRSSSAAGIPAEYSGLPALVARDVWLSYDGATYALRGVDLAVQRGAMTMVLGRSGSGKSSLLKVLKGIVRPQRGGVELATIHSNGRRAEHYVAYVPQSLGLVRNMTALEHTLTGALSYTNALGSLFRIFPRQVMEEARDVLASLAMAHKTNERVQALSGGERQRVAIARALMQRPDAILADEFVSQLDPVTTEDVLLQMRAVTERGVALLITTHETDVAAAFGDRVVVMRDGAIVHDAPATGLARGDMIDLIR